MPYPRYISGHFHTIGQSNSSDFPDSRVWFLGSFSGHFGSHPTFEWRIIKDWTVLDGIETTRQSNRFSLASDFFPLAFDELIDSTHVQKCSQRETNTLLKTDSNCKSGNEVEKPDYDWEDELPKEEDEKDNEDKTILFKKSPDLEEFIWEESKKKL